MPPTNRGHRDRTAVLRDLATAAHPYGLLVERSAHSTLPDLVFLRSSESTELGPASVLRARGRRSVHPNGHPEQSDPGRAGPARDAPRSRPFPLVTRAFLYPLWMDLAD